MFFNRVLASASGVLLAASSFLGAAEVNKLNVRGISVRMSHDEIKAAARAGSLRAIIDTPAQLKFIEEDQSGNQVRGGLVLLINFKNDRSITVYINEQGDMNGHVFEDIQKKWGKATGKDNLGPMWGDPNGVYADYDQNMYGFREFPVSVRKAGRSACFLS